MEFNLGSRALIMYKSSQFQSSINSTKQTQLILIQHLVNLSQSTETNHACIDDFQSIISL